jgi:hypothetical protein
MTAVEYLASLYDWLIKEELGKDLDDTVIKMYRERWLKKAKEMERNQKLQFAEDYHKSKLNNE